MDPQHVFHGVLNDIDNFLVKVIEMGLEINKKSARVIILVIALD